MSTTARDQVSAGNTQLLLESIGKYGWAYVEEHLINLYYTQDIKGALKLLGLPVSGTHASRIDRLRNHFSKAA